MLHSGTCTATNGFADSGPTYKQTLRLQTSPGSTVLGMPKFMVNERAGEAPTQEVLIQDMSDILKAVMDNFCGDEVLELENNPHIRRVKELGAKAIRDKNNL